MSQHVVDEWLDKYLDGELSPAQQERVKAHLEGCAHCQESLAQRRSLSALLQAAPAATGIKPAEQFVSEVNLQLKGQPAITAQPLAKENAWQWAWAAVPLALLLALIFLQTVSVTSDLLLVIPGAERVSQQSVQRLPVFNTLPNLTSNGLAAWGADLFTFFAPANLGGPTNGWLANLVVMVTIGLLYASWIAGWWVRNQHSEGV